MLNPGEINRLDVVDRNVKIAEMNEDKPVR